MNNDAIAELKRIIAMEGTSRKNGRVARETALESWIEYYLVNLEHEQSMVKNKLSLEEEEFVKYHLAAKMGEELMEDCVTIYRSSNKIKASVWALKRR